MYETLFTAWTASHRNNAQLKDGIYDQETLGKGGRTESGWMGGWMDGWMGGWMHGCMHACMDASIHQIRVRKL